jgi:signal transduction histidine kinase
VTGRSAAAIATFGVALAIVTPWPFSFGPLVLALVVALAEDARARAREHDRGVVADYLAEVRRDRPASERPPRPVVLDAVGKRALDVLEAREAELAMSPRSEPPRPPGVRARFMAAMGHELRSPLNSILGFAQLLEDGSDGPLSEAQRENVVLVRRAAADLLTLLTDILDTARIEAGRVRLDRQWIAPVEVLTLARERFRASFDADAPVVEVQLQPGLAPLWVDRARLGQAVLNVLRAAHKGRARLSARVREAREAERPVIRFEILEPDRPISEADAARAFDPDPNARPQGRSLALGLALSVARDLAQLHRGDARCEPFDGGTNWIVWVPAESEDAPSPEPKRPARARRNS